MKTILVIGIGVGDPDQLTVQAVQALNRVDVFFVMDKGPAKTKLRALREEILRRHVKNRTYRVAEAPSPPRDAAPADYRACVDDLNQAKQAVFEKLLADVKDGETGAFLVWGDPMLYDSTIRNLDALKDAGLAFDYDVIPGITAIQALAAAHKIPLNRIAEAVTITTGRKLANGFPPGVDSVVVLLDGEDTFRRFIDSHVHGDVDIYWGAYLSTPDQILIAGKVKDVADEIHRRRSEARRANGWIMDTYLLRRATTPSSR
ncbi:precorrin-6A synthase (deacetylating) [Rhodospirillales bacterium URHD0017]|nr:precorrin-6A synthase (deacetylating) [Rhodospirillales bacterium URHD0017]